MPTAVTKSVDSSEESDEESEPLDVDLDDMEVVERGSATETDDDSNDASEDSEMESEDEVAESDGSSQDDSVEMGEDWSGMFEKAKLFVASHGTMLVPFNHKLFPWLKEQAALFRRAQAGEKKLLTREQKERLQILGVDDFLESPVHKLRDVHVELVWIGEKSRDKKNGQTTLFDWEFIRRNASKELSAEMKKKETFGKRKNTKLPSLVGRGTQTRIAFDALREEVRAAIDSGVEVKLAAVEESEEEEEEDEEEEEEEVEEEEKGEESSENEVNVNTRVYDSDESSSVNLDAMAKNAAVDGSDSSDSDSDNDGDEVSNGMKIVSNVPDDKWGLKPVEEEVAWLGEESMVARKKKSFDWNFIRDHASPELKSLIEEREIFKGKHKNQKMYGLLARMQNKKVKRNFDAKRDEIRKKLGKGYRRKQMKNVLSSSSNDAAEEMNDGLGTVGLSLWQDTNIPVTLELNAAEEDLAWLLEEQARFGKKIGGVDWDYVLEHASPKLKLVMEEKKVREAKSSAKFGLLLRSTPGIKEAFDMKRSDIRKKLADGYRRDSTLTTPSKKATPTKAPTSRNKKSISDFEIEAAHLIEESMFFSDSGRTDWVFIEEHASAGLIEHMNAREIFTKFKSKKLQKLVRLHDEAVAAAFHQKRLEVRQSLADCVYREKMKKILPKKPGNRWKQIFADSIGLAGGKKRSAGEAGLDDVESEEIQKLTDIQQEICWLMQESQFANGNSTSTNWAFVEKHASKKLKAVIQEKKDRNVKYRTVYGFFNIQTNPRLRRAYEAKCSEVRDLLETGHRRKGMEKFLPKGGETTHVEVAKGPRSSKKKAGVRKKAKVVIQDGFLDSSQASANGYEDGQKVSIRQHTVDYPAGVNEWGEATLFTFIDIKMRDGGYSRQYKVRMKNGDLGWSGQDNVRYLDKPSSQRKQQGKSSAQSDKGNAAGSPSKVQGPSYGVYESVFLSIFPSQSLEVALPESSSESQKEQDKAPAPKTAQEELSDLISELQFQRENYRQEMRRQHDRFEAHVSLMEHLEQKAMAAMVKSTNESARVDADMDADDVNKKGGADEDLVRATDKTESADVDMEDNAKSKRVNEEVVKGADKLEGGDAEIIKDTDDREGADVEMDDVDTAAVDSGKISI